MVPERERRAFDVRPVIETIADPDSVTLLREKFAPELVTALARIEGRPVGVIANDSPPHGRHDHQRLGRQGGTLPSAMRELRPARHLPWVDTPASWSGRPSRPPGPAHLPPAGCRRRPDGSADLGDPAPGLRAGAQAMVGGSLHEPLLTVAWPSAHLGPMGLEGAVRLGDAQDLEAIADEEERKSGFAS